MTYGLELQPHRGEKKDEGKVLGEGGLEFLHDLLAVLALAACSGKKDIEPQGPAVVFPEDSSNDEALLF